MRYIAAVFHYAKLPYLQRTIAMWALLCLLALQGLGTLHRAAHGQQRGLQSFATSSKAATLFAGHQTDADCQLFDHICHASAAPSAPVIALPTPTPAAPALAPAWGITALADIALRARGPPVFL